MELQDTLNLAEDVLSYYDYVNFTNCVNNGDYINARIITLRYDSDIRSSILEDFVINLIMENDDENDRSIT